ncbi:MAG: hypothetical protein D3923_11790 [Candidatus Electrothrix sp. AR3]|nr:hypothetical protein [Candidatus Electrothrix sp. AR3]
MFFRLCIRAPRTEMYLGSEVTGIFSLYLADKAGRYMLDYDAVAVQNQIGDYHTGAEAFAQARFLLVNVLCGARKQKRGGRHGTQLQ